MASIKRQLGVSSGIAAGEVFADFCATSGYMHRDLTHGAVRYKPAVRGVARTILWGLGMKPREWAAVHRIHHDKADEPGDPHSPRLVGAKKLLFTNQNHYRESVQKLRRTGLPDDLQPDEVDKKLFDKSAVGLAANLAGHVAVNKALGNNPAMGLVSFGLSKVGYIAGGNLVNTFGHLGKKPAEAFWQGKYTAHEDGSLGSDNAAIGVLTLGEGWQKNHHDDPGRLYFGPEETTGSRHAIYDIVGSGSELLVRHGLAEMPTGENS